MSIRAIGLVIMAVLAAALLFFLLAATDTALSVWQRLEDERPLLRWLILSLLALFAMTSVWLIWRFVRREDPVEAEEPQAIDPNALKAELRAAQADGVDVEAILEQLEAASTDKQTGTVRIALYGEVSTGKSTLVNALLPGADAESSVLAGSTEQTRIYRWVGDSGDVVLLHDLPGIADDKREDDQVQLEEVRAAHLVLFLVDGDLTRSEHEALTSLKGYNKPLLLAINKSDQLDDSDRDLIRSRIAENTGIAKGDIYPISTGGMENVVLKTSDGSEQAVLRPREPNIQPLLYAIQRVLDGNRELIESLNDSAILLLASEKLEAAKIAHLQSAADEIITRYSKRAMVGALAAITPGSDLIIQSVIGSKMVQALSELYGVRTRDVEIDEFLKLAGSRLKNMSAITLAIAGNAFKAFPGAGTVTGGLMHSVAYGMIVHSLGHAAASTLASRKRLSPHPAAIAFEEHLSEDLRKRVGEFARLAITQHRKKQ